MEQRNGQSNERKPLNSENKTEVGKQWWQGRAKVQRHGSTKSIKGLNSFRGARQRPG